MKKILTSFLILFVAVMLTGCSLTKQAEKTKETVQKRVESAVKTELDCKQSLTESGISIDIDFDVTFLGSLVKDIEFSYDMDLTSYNDAQIEAVSQTDLCTTVKDAMTDYKDAFIDCKQKVEDKHIIIESELDIDKIAKNELQKLQKPSTAKEELEKEGYTCTIEKDND